MVLNVTLFSDNYKFTENCIKSLNLDITEEAHLKSYDEPFMNGYTLFRTKTQ